MQTKRAAEENAILLGGKKLRAGAADVARRLGIRESSFLRAMRHYMTEAENPGTAAMSEKALRSTRVRCPACQFCIQCLIDQAQCSRGEIERTLLAQH